MINNQIEDLLKEHFQKGIRIVLDDTVIKQGRFILVKYNSFAVDLYIKSSKPKLEVLSLPIPFDFREEGGVIVFDYNIEHIVIKDTALHKDVIEYVKRNKVSKFFNRKLELIFS